MKLEFVENMVVTLKVLNFALE